MSLHSRDTNIKLLSVFCLVALSFAHIDKWQTVGITDTHTGLDKVFVKVNFFF